MSLETNRAIAKYLVSVFGNSAGVREHLDEDESHDVSILRCENVPDEGIVSYGTITLSNHPITDDEGVELDFRVEIVAAMPEEDKEFSLAISTCAFNVIKDKMPIFPGRIFPRVLELYPGLSDTLEHVMFVTPIAWGNNPQTQEFSEHTVTFLQALPISNGEMEYARTNSSEALENLLEENQIDIYDIDRPSVI